ncbi:hypothetical protein JCGZ_04873 [Jatropha curcas]|uniref:Phytocyanin domain-containing protein n=1 Tax=Jatropha curcas TaxID=180498 RepID=A0A067L192_JATCU|nr:hypothetical protein JCGZ_04873 [Jatropha curcas]
MDSTLYIQGLVIVLCASLSGVSVATSNQKVTPNKITVGGSSRWTFGFDYSVWAFKKAPFFVNDTLVFKYDLPRNKNEHPHSVYLLPDLWSMLTCNLTNGVKIAKESQGTGKGFEFVMKKWKPYYFACGGGNGFHCNFGNMKFFVQPLRRRLPY